MASNELEPTGKPADIPGGDFEGCVAYFSDDASVDDPEALCAWLEDKGKEALADPNADEVLTSLGVEYVSAVDVPAQDSEWLIAKNAEDPTGDNHRWKTEVPVFVSKDYADFEEAEASKDDGDKQIAFAPVLVPGEADKQGDVIPDHEIEKAAHGYLSNHRKVDTDHDLFDGKGTPVESWTLKRDMSFTKPDGTESRTYPKGTWVMGIKFDDETWSRLKSGELGGLSIYGGAKPLQVDALRDALGVTPSTETKSKGTDTDTDKMSNENDDADGTDDGTENVTKQLDAGTVSSMLEVFSDKVDNGLSTDATVKDFVSRLIEDGDVDETQVTGLSVFLEGNGGSTDDGGDMGDDGEDTPGPPEDAQADLEMSNKSDGDGGDADANTDGGTTDGASATVGTGSLPDDTPDWAKSLSEDVSKSVESVADDVADLRGRVDELETEVKGENLNERMDDDDFEKRFKSFLGVEDDADTETVRKAFREQYDAAAEDEPLAKSFEGLFDDDEDTATAAKSASGRNAHSNIRMPNAEGDD